MTCRQCAHAGEARLRDVRHAVRLAKIFGFGINESNLLFFMLVEQAELVTKRFVADKPVRNNLLTLIPESEFDAMKPHLQFVIFDVGECLERAGEPLRAAYFPNREICSLLVETSDARSVEVGLAGYEEIVDLTLVGGVDRLPYSVVVQTAGEGFRIASSTMKRILAFMPELTRMLVRHL